MKRTKKCLYCGKEFSTQSAVKKYCCMECAEAAKLERGEISKEEYDRWRYKYPELDKAGRWAKVPSQALSDALIEELKKE